MPAKKSTPKKAVAKKTVAKKVVSKTTTPQIFNTYTNFILLAIFCLLVGILFVIAY